MNFSIEQALKSEGFLIHTIQGDSMLPLLDENNDTVRLILAEKPLKKYDIPLYRRPSGQLVLHRILKIMPDGYITCGDNRWKTEFVPFDWVVAVAEGVYKGDCFMPLNSKEMTNYAKSITNKRFLRFLKFLPSLIFKKVKRIFK